MSLDARLNAAGVAVVVDVVVVVVAGVIAAVENVPGSE